jgi:hypothetical protein
MLTVFYNYAYTQYYALSYEVTSDTKHSSCHIIHTTDMINNNDSLCPHTK